MGGRGGEEGGDNAVRGKRGISQSLPSLKRGINQSMPSIQKGNKSVHAVHCKAE